MKFVTELYSTVKKVDVYLIMCPEPHETFVKL